MPRRILPARPTVVLSLGLAALALAGPGVGRAEAPAPDRLTLRLAAGPTFVHGPSAFGGVSSLGLDVGFGRFFAFEVGGAVSLSGGDHRHAGLRVSTGLRLGARSGPTRPYVGVRAAHLHDAPRASYREHPGQALSGDPRYGLGHVTLAGGTLGVVFAPAHGASRLRAVFEVETLFVAHRYHTDVVLTDPPRAYTSATLGLGIRLL